MLLASGGVNQTHIFDVVMSYCRGDITSKVRTIWLPSAAWGRKMMNKTFHCHWTDVIFTTFFQAPHQPGQPGFKFTVAESCDRIKDEFQFLQAQYHR